MFDSADGNNQYYTNTIQLRDRKPASDPTRSRFLEKVAKFGQYELPLLQFSARLPKYFSTVHNNNTTRNKRSFRNEESERVTGKDESNQQCVAFRSHERKRSRIYKWRRRSIVRFTTISSKSKRKVSLQTWRANMLSNLSGHEKNPKKIRQLVWNGVPSSIRNEFWSALVGNKLNLDETIYDRCVQLMHQSSKFEQRSKIEPSVCKDQGFLISASQLNRECSICGIIFSHVNSAPIRHEVCSPYLYSSIDGTMNFGSKLNIRNFLPGCRDRSVFLTFVKRDISLTFNSLRLFQVGCPFHAQLHDLLVAYLAYQPQIGYVPGMSFLAAVLLLVVGDAFTSFVLFANILDRPCHRAFYDADETEFIVRCRAFNQLLSDRVPQLHRHFVRVGLEPNMYLFDWLFCIFSRSLPLDCVLRVWDLYCLEGELILFRVALTLLVHFQTELLSFDLDQLMIFLARPLPLNLTGEQLVKLISLTRLKRQVWSLYLNGSRAKLHASKCEQRPIFTVSGQNGRAFFQSNVKDLESLGLSSWNNVDLSTLDYTTVPPGLVDHSTRSLCSCGSTISLDSVDALPYHVANQSTTPLHFDTKTSSICPEFDEKIPWTSDPRVSPYPSAIFTFDEPSLSAPPDVHTFIAERKQPARCASELVVSSYHGADKVIGISQAASTHELGRLTFDGTQVKLKSVLSRSRSMLFGHSQFSTSHPKSCHSSEFKPDITKLFPLELIP